MSTTKTPEFRVSYPNVFKPKKNDLNGKDEYSLVALFKKGENLEGLKKTAMDAIVKKWGSDKSKWPTNLRTPFRDQNERMKEGKLPDGYEAGAIFINLRATQRPGLVEINPGNNALEDITDTSKFYAGCFAKATVSCYAYDNKGNRGVAFGLSNILKTRDGDNLTGRTNAYDDFADVRSEAAANASVNTGADATSLF